MKKINFYGEVLEASDGELLSTVLMRYGKAVAHPCGGRGECGKCTVIIDGKEELSCRYKVNSDISVSAVSDGEIHSDTGVCAESGVTDNMCLVLDIGTTTLALALVSLDNKSVVKTVTATNPQCVFGADVISRIAYCTENSAKNLQKVLVDEVNKMIFDVGLRKVEKLYTSGNTTMLHILFGEDCSSMGFAPYTPSFLDGRCVSADLLGVVGVDFVESLPCVSAFVGADIVAGMNLVGYPEDDGYTLLIDLGTNAEVVLMSKNGSVSTSAAAGPCFEGSGISCGMSATSGAVCACYDGVISTVDGAEAKGICGTGLIDVVAYLLDQGIVDSTGFMELGEFALAENVVITQADIRQYQLAKSAVFSAIMSLVKYNAITLDDISRVYISGGFSAGINVSSAVRTGLLPAELAEKCVALKNSSLLGAIRYVCEETDLSLIVQKTKYIDLSADAFFADMFIENMSF